MKRVNIKMIFAVTGTTLVLLTFVPIIFFVWEALDFPCMICFFCFLSIKFFILWIFTHNTVFPDVTCPEKGTQGIMILETMLNNYSSLSPGSGIRPAGAREHATGGNIFKIYALHKSISAVKELTAGEHLSLPARRCPRNDPASSISKKMPL